MKLLNLGTVPFGETSKLTHVNLYYHKDAKWLQAQFAVDETFKPGIGLLEIRTQDGSSIEINSNVGIGTLTLSGTSYPITDIPPAGETTGGSEGDITFCVATTCR